MTKRTRHPVFKEEEFTDADDSILSVTQNSIPDFVDRMFGLKKEEEEQHESKA